MSQTPTRERTAQPSTTPRVSFWDDNRELHLQLFFNWLPEEFHDLPLIDWTQLPSKVLGYFVNSVGDSPFAIPLAIAAFAGVGPVKNLTLRQSLTSINCLLQQI